MASEDSDDGHPTSWTKSPKILIIGAGIAGVSAGTTLVTAGFTDFIILEASDRVGGRIWSIDLETANGQKAELGANWVHGVDQNPIFKLAAQNGLLSRSSPGQGRKLGQKVMFAKEHGEPVNTKVVEEVDWTFGMLMAQTEDFYQMRIPTPVENDSVGAFLSREFESKMDRYQGQDYKLRRMIFDQRMLNEAVISGCDNLDQVALSEVGCFQELPGVHYVIPPGFEAVPKLLVQNIPKESILLNHVVTQVTWHASHNSANNANNANNKYPVCVECANGKKFYADHVLVTTSLGCLKKSCGRMFNPQLPEFKLSAIDRLSIGTVDKVILEFSERVLPEGVTRLECIWDRDCSDRDDIKNDWVKKIGAFEAIAETVLVGWLCGKEAEYMETLSEQEIGKRCLEVLKSFLKGKPLPPLKRIVVSRWHSAPYTRGSYTYIPTGASTEDIESLAEPVSDDHDMPILMFAGEATHSTFYSSSHGAFLSGQREANRLVNVYRH